MWELYCCTSAGQTFWPRYLLRVFPLLPFISQIPRVVFPGVSMGGAARPRSQPQGMEVAWGGHPDLLLQATATFPPWYSPGVGAFQSEGTF